MRSFLAIGGHRIPPTATILTILFFLLSACVPLETITPEHLPPDKPATATPAPVMLVMGSWRTDDVIQMNYILNQFHEEYPNIYVKFDPTPSEVYDDALFAQLKSGTGPDIFYLRSFSVSQRLYLDGYVESLDSLPGLHDNFSSISLSPWQTDDGNIYGVPFIASSHGIFYNKDIFDKLGMEIPQTWEELLSDSKRIKDFGYIPFANASGDKWTIAELVYMSIAPNFIGGVEGRMAYLEGKRCFNDEQIVASFQAIKDLAPYLPPNQGEIKYVDSQQLFLQGKAAMWLSGSFDIAYIESQQTGFEWSIFPVPAPTGKPTYVTFHPDAAIGLNPDSKYKEEAKIFLQWIQTAEFSSLLGNQLPGLFPLRINPPEISDPYVKTFIDFNINHATDIRFAWEKLRDGSPDGYTLMLEGALAVLNYQIDPQQAADNLQDGLAQWYKPAQECER